MDYSERPTNDKRSPRPKQTDMTHATTQGHCPTPQNSPTYLAMITMAAAPAKPHRTKIWMASMFEKAATQDSIQE